MLGAQRVTNRRSVRAPVRLWLLLALVALSTILFAYFHAHYSRLLACMPPIKLRYSRHIYAYVSRVYMYTMFGGSVLPEFVPLSDRSFAFLSREKTRLVVVESRQNRGMNTLFGGPTDLACTSSLD